MAPGAGFYFSLGARMFADWPEDDPVYGFTDWNANYNIKLTDVTLTLPQ
jgi:hypothetical protein